MALNRIYSYVRSLIGVKGKDGSLIATPANAFPVQVDGRNGTAVASDTNPIPVGPIAGQNGVAANTGAADALTQRVTLASGDLGTDGTSPPTIPGGGTGVRGWLRAIFGAFKAEDSAAVSGDLGILALATRNDAEVALTNADGDYTTHAADGAGRMVVKRTASAANIRNGSRTSNGTLITLAAGETWVGQCLCSLSAKANPGTAGGDFQVKISWTPGGSGGTPAFDVTVAQASISQVLLTSLIGENAQATSPVANVIIAAGTSGGTLDVNVSGSPAQAFAGAIGTVEAKT